jgi:hypothetical protein
VSLALDGGIAVVWMFLRARALTGAPAMPLAEWLQIASTNAPQMLVQVGKLLAPIRLNVSPSVDLTGIVIGVVAVIVLVVVATRLVPRGLAIVAGVWVAAFLVPPLGVPDLPAYEHRNYLALAGVLLALAAASSPLSAGASPGRRERSRVGDLPFAGQLAVWVAVVILAAGTYARQPVFRDAFAYWTDASRDAGFASRAHVNLGQLLEGVGQLDEAARAYRRALEIDPLTPKAHNNLGVVSMKLNEPEAAVWHFNEEVKLHPSNHEAWFNLGLVAERHGRDAEARGLYERALRENPMFRPAAAKLGQR